MNIKRIFILALTIVGVLILIGAIALLSGSSNKINLNKPNAPFDAASTESIAEYYNYCVDIYAQVMALANTENTDALDDLSFSIDDYVLSGDFKDRPELVVLRDRMLYASKVRDDWEGNPVTYSNLQRFYDEGTVQVDRSGETVEVTTSESFNFGSYDEGELEALREAIYIYENDITPTQKKLVYRIERSYVNELTEAMGLKDTDFALLGLTRSQFCNLEFTLDLTDYAHHSVVKLIISGSKLSRDIVVAVDLSKYGDRYGEVSLTVELASLIMELELEWEENGLIELTFDMTDSTSTLSVSVDGSYNAGARRLPRRASPEDCNALRISASVEANDEDLLFFKLNAAELRGDRWAGAFELELSSSVELSGTVGQLSDLAQGDIEASGSFVVMLDGDELRGVECDLEANSDSMTLALDLSADLNNVRRRGREVLRARIETTETEKNKEKNSSTLLTLKTTSSKRKHSVLSLNCELVEDDEEKSISATVNIPATREIPLGDEEQMYISRADKLYENYDAVLDKIDSINSAGLTFANRNLFMIPTSQVAYYYCYDDETEQYFVTLIVKERSGFSIITQAVLDYENIPVYYSKHDGSFVLIRE